MEHLEGGLDRFRIPEILRGIAGDQRTGILTVQGEEDMIAISFLEGEVVAADALSQTVEEVLARILVERGLVSREDFSALEDAVQEGERLIDLLVERRYLTRAQVLEALRLQTLQLIRQVLEWRHGEFKFYGGDEVSYEEGFVPIAVEQLLGQPARAEARAAASRPAPSPLPTQGGELLEFTPSRRGSRPAPASPVATKVPFSPPRKPAPPTAMPEERPRPAAWQLTLPLDEVRTWSCRILAMGLGVLVVSVFLSSPARLLLPFQARQRLALEDRIRTSTYLRLERAAKTFFLLDGHFPDRLEDLERRGLIAAADQLDPRGRTLGYSATDVDYQILPIEAGQPLAQLGWAGRIAGNFMLDPQFAAAAPRAAEQPLVLLD